MPALPTLFPRLSVAVLFLAGLFPLAPLPAQVPAADGGVPLNFNGDHPNALLSLLEELTGDVILRPQNLPNAEIVFNSGENLDRTFSRDEAIAIIESLLAMHGVTIIEIDVGKSRAVPTPVVNAFSPDIITDTAEAGEETQRVYTLLHTFEQINLDEALEVIQGMVTTGMPAPIRLKKSNSLLISDALANLRRIESVLEKLDRPVPFDQSLRFIPLENIAASEAKERIESLVETSLTRYVSSSLVIEADERTNQLIFVGKSDNLDILEEVLNELDKDIEPLTRTRVFRVKHAEATVLAGLLEQVISGQQEVLEEQRRGSGNRGGAVSPAQQRARAQAQAQAAAAAAGDGPANVQFSEFVGLFADERSNSIVAYGTTSDLTYIEDLLSQIDVLLDQVRIEVIIAEVSLQEDQARGIESFGLGLDDAGGVTSLDFNLAGASSPSLGQTFGFEGSINDVEDFAATLENFSLSTVFDTAKRNDRVQVLSAPTIVTTHNKLASINVSESRPIITSSQTDTTGTAVRSNVQFRDIGIQLEVKPLISDNGVIQLEIKQVVENVVSTVEIDGNQQPIIGKREAESFIGVRDQEVVILGGLQEVNRSESKGKVSFFGAIPVVGDLLFSSKSEENDVRELIIFIKPFLISGADAAKRAADVYRGSSRLDDQLDYFLETGKFRDPPRTRSFLFFNWTEEPDPLPADENGEDAEEEPSAAPLESNHPNADRTYRGFRDNRN